VETDIKATPALQIWQACPKPVLMVYVRRKSEEFYVAFNCKDIAAAMDPGFRLSLFELRLIYGDQ
jgi:hypothetical protein